MKRYERKDGGIEKNGKDIEGSSRRVRRGSPEYEEYRRPASPPAVQAPWRQQENMYPPRRGGERDKPYGGDGPRDRPYGGDGARDRPYGGDGGGSDYFESRRLQRFNSTFSIWPPSPKAPAHKLSPERGSKSRRKHKRSRSSSVSSSEDSEDERRRRERKERKRARKDKERSGKKERHKETRSHKRYSDDEDEDRDRERRKRSRTKSKERRRRSPTPTKTRSPSPPNDEVDEEWVEKPAASAPSVSNVGSHVVGSMGPPPVPKAISHDDAGELDGSDDEMGPQPVMRANSSKKLDERAYGGALLRGEGSAMAAFLQDGTDMRIPRRGEIGLDSDEIAAYESVGYVMSGSRHRRMNAVRMRKENQVISAEEKRGILKLQQEERERREAILREEFQELLNDKLKDTEIGRVG